MKIQMLGSALIAGLICLGCGGSDSAVADEALITVNGLSLMRSQLDSEAEKLLAPQLSQIPTNRLDYARKMVRNNLVETFVIGAVLSEKAKAAGVVVTDADREGCKAALLKRFADVPNAPKTVEEFMKSSPLGEKRAMEEFEKGILIEKFVKAEVAKMTNSVDYAKQEMEALVKIKGYADELAKVSKDKLNEKFAELAKAHSDCPSSQRGGDLDFFGRHVMAPEFEKAAFELPVGKVSEPVKTDFGYHLILVTEKKDDQVRASHILVKCSNRKQDERQLTMEYVQKAVREAKITAVDEFKHFLPPQGE